MLQGLSYTSYSWSIRRCLHYVFPCHSFYPNAISTFERPRLEKSLYNTLKQCPVVYAGAIFSITASFQMLASIGSTVLFNKVYHPQADVNGHHVNAGIVFWIIAGFWGTAIPFVL